MKKLLAIATALVGASAMAVTTFSNTTEDFERLTAGDFNPVTAQDDNESISRWESSGDQTGTITAYGADDALTAPTEFDGGNNYLHVDSGSDTLLRHSVEPTSDGTNLEYDSPSLGVYVDCWTQFTAADERDSLGNTDGDKLRVYLYKDSANNDALSFHVVAGYLADSGDNSTATDYAVTCEDIDPAEGTWYHLTIKSIADIVGNGSNVPGFIVFINGTPAVNSNSKGVELSSIGKATGAAKAYNEAGQLFPSLVKYSAGDNAKKLIGIGFRGTGNVDNISFTDKATFEANNSYAVDPVAEYALTVVVDGGTATGADTFEKAFEAISGTPESVLITMNASLALPATGVSPAYALTIDLNGKNLTGPVFVNRGTVTIKNTAATASSIVGSAETDVIMNMGNLTIGTGDIVVEETIWQMGGSLTLLSGKYKVKPTSTGADEAEFTNPDGKTLVAGTGDDAGYYVLGSEGGSEGTTITDDDGSSFTVPTSVMTAAKAATKVTDKDYNYAQAYALGLYDTTTEEVTGDPVVTIEIVNGVVTVKFEAGDEIPEAYSVSYEVYGSTTLKGRTEAGWTKIGDTAAYGTAVTDDTVGENDDAKFYMVKVTITDK